MEKSIVSHQMYGLVLSLNYENKFEIGHESYEKSTFLDITLLNGIENDRRIWAEHIIGDYTLGYWDSRWPKSLIWTRHS